MVGFEVDPTTLVEPIGKGPVCADCNKPVRLAADKGGCGCPRHPVRDVAQSPVKAAAERQAVAMEGILDELKKIARKLEAK